MRKRKRSGRARVRRGLSFVAHPRCVADRRRVHCLLMSEESTIRDPKENFLDWLRDAHAMAHQAEQMLRAQSSRLENLRPASINTWKRRSSTKAGCRAQCAPGESTSTTKDLTAKFMAFGQAAGRIAMSDEVVKGSITSYVFENLEIASHTSLIAATELVRDEETERAWEQILPQEVAMAQWLLDQIAGVTHAFLPHSATPDQTATR
jgi:ferritin-like metal-binding protein YciE